MPALIESRPFTIHPETYAWPSFKLFSMRVVYVYAGFAVLLAGLLWQGLRMSVGLAIVAALIMLAIGIGMSYMKYLAYLRKPANRHLFTGCRVSLSEEELREDFEDGSHITFKLFAITEVREISDYYFIFATKQHAMVVPRTAFSSPEEAQVFAATIKSAIGKAPS